MVCPDCGGHPTEVTSAHLAISVEHAAQPVVVRLRGELDVSNLDELRGVFDALLRAGPRPIVVDLSGLSFADCGGMSVLVAARHRLAGHGHDLTVTAPQPIVRRLLTLTGMDTLFRLGEDEHHATRTRTDR
ncbi:MAG TPA: STAS domain-containing protein [Streptosporangiaceae bacterium]|nr:STAS domain-containing protein [Streptosporangiaceae bacterium]